MKVFSAPKFAEINLNLGTKGRIPAPRSPNNFDHVAMGLDEKAIRKVQISMKIFLYSDHSKIKNARKKNLSLFPLLLSIFCCAR